MFTLTTLADIKSKLLSQGKTAEAVKIAVFATQEFPDSSHSWFHLGEARYRHGDAAGAREALWRCLALSPQNGPALSLLDQIDGATKH